MIVEGTKRNPLGNMPLPLYVSTSCLADIVAFPARGLLLDKLLIDLQFLWHGRITLCRLIAASVENFEML